MDEAHHVSAVSFERVLREVKARYVLGLTATPYRRDGHHPILHMQCGPVRANPRGVGAGEDVPRVLVRRDTGVLLPDLAADAPITQVYAALADHAGRTALIVADVVAAAREGRAPIVLTERLAHVRAIRDAVEAVGVGVVELRGGLGKKAKAAADAALAAPADVGRPTVVVATGRFVGEGFDHDRLDTLFLALPVSWKGIVEQYVGRLHRPRPGKREVRVVDYVDGSVPRAGAMWERRKKKYRAMGYVEAEAASGQGALGFEGCGAGGGT